MKLIKPACSTCKALAKAIDAYIAKADNDLSSEMSDAGYVDAKDSVKAANDLEEEVYEILTEQSEELAEVVENAGTIPKAKKKVSEYFETDVTGTILSQTFADYFSETVLSLSDSYMKETEGDLVVSRLRSRTNSWIEEWSDQLSDLMQLTSENQMGTLLQEALDNGEGCMTLAQRILNEGIRNEGYRARATAVTEMLRAHSVAQQESIMQSPATDRKKWVHSGAHKNKPRENHIAMSGQIVPKAEPFELTGRDGGTYHPMYPRDPILPAAESINCHCIHIPVSNDDILGLSYEERQQMQQEIIAADDAEWEKILNMTNRVRSGLPAEEQEYGVAYGADAIKVDEAEIKKPKWRNKFKEVIQDKKVRRSVIKYSRKALTDNSGTLYESMYLIDAENGSLIASIELDEDKIEKGIHYTDDFRERLKKAQEEKRKIIAIHNHPEGYPPSPDDFRKANENGYSVGIVVGHNGQVYSYSNPEIELTEGDCDNMQDMISNLYSAGFDVDHAHEDVYNSVGLEYTIN